MVGIVLRSPINGDRDLPETKGVCVEGIELGLVVLLYRLLQGTDGLRLHKRHLGDLTGVVFHYPAVELESGRHQERLWY